MEMLLLPCDELFPVSLTGDEQLEDTREATEGGIYGPE
jgi:hypothetical protein